MTKYFLLLGLILTLTVWFFANGKKSKLATPQGSVATVTIGSSDEVVTDILSATNLEQWKSLVFDLKQDRALPNHWSTSRFRPGSPPVLLKQNNQSIIYKAEAIDVSILSKTTNFMEAQIYSPKMSIKETRELGLKLCSMFDLNSDKFLAWCNTVGTNWLDMPLFSAADRNHLYYYFSVRRSYSDEKPWFIIFTIQQESALSELMRRFPNKTDNKLSR